MTEFVGPWKTTMRTCRKSIGCAFCHQDAEGVGRRESAARVGWDIPDNRRIYYHPGRVQCGVAWWFLGDSFPDVVFCLFLIPRAEGSFLN